MDRQKKEAYVVYPQTPKVCSTSALTSMLTPQTLYTSRACRKLHKDANNGYVDVIVVLSFCHSCNRNLFRRLHTLAFENRRIMPTIILITGANRGIALCMVQRIAERSEDCCVLVASRDVSAAKEAIASLTGLKATLQPIALDVTSDDSIRACLTDIEKKHGKLDGKDLTEQCFNHNANASVSSPSQQRSNWSEPIR